MKGITLISITSLFLFTGCERKPDAASSSATVAPGIQLDDWFSPSPPAGAQAIHLIRSQVKSGDEVTISGRIMGRSKPFVDGRAAFILGDPAKLTPCNERPDDECEEPWDVCCDSAEAKKIGTATIQLVDAEGRVLKQSLKGSHGLTELATVTLTGVVAPESSPESLIINATRIHVGPKS
jgi:hypothetical protein